MKVEDVMRKDEANPVISINAGIKQMMSQITSYHVGAISVTDDHGKLLGLVTDYDIRRVLESEQNIFALAIADIMCHNPAVINSGEKAMVALDMMRNREKPIAILPVVDANGRAIGMVHLHDLISAGL